MRKLPLVVALATLLLGTAVHADDKKDKDKPEDKPDAVLLKPQASETSGTVKVEGKSIDYKAVAGTLVLHGSGDKESEPQISMFYAAYFKKGAEPGKRPITFIYNGGPGSATVWLHMGAFGPRRVVTSDDSHTPAAPPKLERRASAPVQRFHLHAQASPRRGTGHAVARYGGSCR